LDPRNPELASLLECVAIDDALDGVLLLGASAAFLDAVALRLEMLLTAAGADQVDRVRLGSADTEDSLWGVPGLPPGWGGRGLLVPSGNTTRIVVVPDLSRLSQAAARAGVVMLGASAVRVERHGQTHPMKTRHRWLAALSDENAGSVSPHLMERFPIQIRVKELGSFDRIGALKRRLSVRPGSDLKADAGLTRVKNRSPDVLSVEVEALDLLSELCTADRVGSSMRTPIALMNLARAAARLARVETVTVEIMRDAGANLGVLEATPAPDEPMPPGQEPYAPKPPTPADSSNKVTDEPVAPRLVQHIGDTGDVSAGDVRSVGADDVMDPGDPFEDAQFTSAVIKSPDAPATPHEYTTLRLPWRQSRTASSGRGPVIGVRRTDVLQDLAVVATLFAAAPFQRMRREALKKTTDEIVLRRRDLRAYRRAPPAGELLVLVLDYTSLKRRKWHRTLLPYLADAYEARAEVCIVKVGAKDAPNDTRAERLLARSILVPSVVASLDEDAGTATPLADGLFQAHRTIQQTLGHGRGSTRKATLIVLSDGRGNVSLQSSRLGRVTERVARQGLDDARRVAHDIRMLTNIKRVLINPEPDYMKELPFALAAAMGATVVRLVKTNA
jgi:magnesium chelatase subunit D